MSDTYTLFNILVAEFARSYDGEYFTSTRGFSRAVRVATKISRKTGADMDELFKAAEMASHPVAPYKSAEFAARFFNGSNNS
jgi:hypothetical protein